MKGNNKIAFTAEAVALMRSLESSDEYSKYFVSDKTKRRYNVARVIVPNKYLRNLSRKRISLSQDLDKMINQYKPEQIIELACGYSPRGLLMTQKNSKLVYIETDFSLVIKRKLNILRNLQKNDKVKLSKNHHLVEIDAIDSDLYQSLKKLIDPKKKTLIVAETLTSYLNPLEHDFLIKNIERLLNKINHGAYLSHEGNKMLPGLFGKILLFYRNRVAKTQSHKHFEGLKEIRNYFESRGAKKIKIYESKRSNNIIYLVVRK